MDIVGTGLAFKLTGMSTREGMVFFSFATLKTGTKRKSEGEGRESIRQRMISGIGLVLGAGL